MKKWRKYLAALLMSVLTASLLPAQTLAAAAEVAYTVLAESTIDVYQLGTPYEDINVIDSKTVVKYDGSRIQTVNLSISVGESVYVYGFSPSGYANVNQYTSDWAVINAEGKVVYQPEEGEWSGDLSDDGYLTITQSYDEDLGDYTRVLVDLSTGRKIRPADLGWPDGSGKSLVCYNDGLLMVRQKGVDAENRDTYSYHYEDLKGNTVLSGDFTSMEPFKNGFTVQTRYTSDYRYYREIIDQTGRVVLSDRETDSLRIDSVGTDDMVTLRDSNFNRRYAKLSDGLDNLPSSRFDDGRDFCNGYAVVRNNRDAVGLIDTAGRSIIPFGSFKNLSDVSSTGLVWAVDNNDHLCVLKVQSTAPEYIYDTPDPGADLVLPAEKLEDVDTQAEAVRAVRSLTSSMTQAQKDAPTGIDLATLYAETAAAKVATKEVTGNELLINAAALEDLQKTAQQTTEAVESALVSGGVTTARYVAKTVTLSTSATGKITFRVDPDVLTADVDKIRVETPDYAVTLDLDELEPDLTEVLTFSAEAKKNTMAVSRAMAAASISGAMALSAAPAPVFAVERSLAVELGLPTGGVTNSVTLSLPTDSGDQTYKAVVNESGKAAASKFNPATTDMDGKVNDSGTYRVTQNEVNFSDISGKSAEMQKAIRYLASKGIINGTSATTFSPNDTITRAEIAALLVRSLGWNSSSAIANFTDVTRADWFYSAAASSQAHNLIKGFEDRSFRGRTNIAKDQIVVVSSRVLKEKMSYKEPANTASYLARYSDSVAGWAQGEVALAARENLIVPRVDGTFKGANAIARGDAAIIIYRLFQKIW